MAVIKYHDWLIETDREQNEQLYKQVETTGTQSCGCENCKYFDSISHRVFPAEIRELFEALGVDIDKNCDVSDFGTEETGHMFLGRFQFVGSLLEGHDSSVPTASGGFTVDLLPLNDTFKIGFTKLISDSFFKDVPNLVQIEFMARELYG